MPTRNNYTASSLIEHEAEFSHRLRLGYAKPETSHVKVLLVFANVFLGLGLGTVAITIN